MEPDRVHSNTDGNSWVQARTVGRDTVKALETGVAAIHDRASGHVSSSDNEAVDSGLVTQVGSLISHNLEKEHENESAESFLTHSVPGVRVLIGLHGFSFPGNEGPVESTTESASDLGDHHVEAHGDVDFLVIVAEHEGQGHSWVQLGLRDLPPENSQHPEADEHDLLILGLK